MISSVSSNSSMSMMASRAMQRQPPPADKDVFKVADSDSDGLVSSTELKTLAAGMEKVTGNSINVDEALSTYDTDGDGSLNGEELFGLMTSQGFNPADITNSEGDEGGMKPPPPPPEKVTSAYASNSSEDTIGQLIELLNDNSDGEAAYSAFDMTA